MLKKIKKNVEKIKKCWKNKKIFFGGQSFEGKANNEQLDEEDTQRSNLISKY